MSSGMQWFRFHAEVLDDPKVQKLDPATFKHWVNLLCLACRHGGKLPSHDDIAFALRIDVFATESLLDRLLIAGLIDVNKGGANGSHIAPHGWAKRQYKSDTSTVRVKRFRERSKTVSETAPETEAETETEYIEPNGSCPSEAGPALTFDLVVKQWNAMAADCGLPKVEKKTEARKRAFRVRSRENPEIDDWRRAIVHIAETPFLCGDNKTGWKADFDFLLQAKSFPRLVEGTYGRG